MEKNKLVYFCGPQQVREPSSGLRSASHLTEAPSALCTPPTPGVRLPAWSRAPQAEASGRRACPGTACSDGLSAALDYIMLFCSQFTL